MVSAPRPASSLATAGLVMAAVAFIAWPHAAQSQVADAPRVQPGDTWNFAVSLPGHDHGAAGGLEARTLRRPT